MERPEQGVGFEPQRVSLRWHKIQGVEGWIQLVAAAQLHQQVHQSFAGRWEEKEVNVSVCVLVCKCVSLYMQKEVEGEKESEEEQTIPSSSPQMNLELTDVQDIF